MTPVAGFNLFEAILWFAFSLFFLLRSTALKRIVAAAKEITERQKKAFRFLSAVFFLFGLSDLIEIRTGAWWDPPWLLLLKGVCVVGIIAGLILLYRGCRD